MAADTVSLYGNLIKDGSEHWLGGESLVVESRHGTPVRSLEHDLLIARIEQYLKERFVPSRGCLLFPPDRRALLNDELFSRILAGIRNGVSVTLLLSYAMTDFDRVMLAVRNHSLIHVKYPVSVGKNHTPRDSAARKHVKAGNFTVVVSLGWSRIFFPETKVSAIDEMKSWLHDNWLARRDQLRTLAGAGQYGNQVE